MSVQVEVTSCLQNLVFIVVLRNPTWHGARCQVQLSLRRFLRSFHCIDHETLDFDSEPRLGLQCVMPCSGSCALISVKKLTL